MAESNRHMNHSGLFHCRQREGQRVTYAVVVLPRGRDELAAVDGTVRLADDLHPLDEERVAEAAGVLLELYHGTGTQIALAVLGQQLHHHLEHLGAVLVLGQRLQVLLHLRDAHLDRIVPSVVRAVPEREGYASVRCGEGVAAAVALGLEKLLLERYEGLGVVEYLLLEAPHLIAQRLQAGKLAAAELVDGVLVGGDVILAFLFLGTLLGLKLRHKFGAFC